MKFCQTQILIKSIPKVYISLHAQTAPVPAPHSGNKVLDDSLDQRKKSRYISNIDQMTRPPIYFEKGARPTEQK